MRERSTYVQWLFPLIKWLEWTSLKKKNLFKICHMDYFCVTCFRVIFRACQVWSLWTVVASKEMHKSLTKFVIKNSMVNIQFLGENFLNSYLDKVSKNKLSIWWTINLLNLRFSEGLKRKLWRRALANVKLAKQAKQLQWSVSLWEIKASSWNSAWYSHLYLTPQ